MAEAPLRPRNPFMQFCHESRDEFRKRFPHLTMVQLSTELGLAYGLLDDGEKARLAGLYAADKIRYARELAEYLGKYGALPARKQKNRREVKRAASNEDGVNRADDNVNRPARGGRRAKTVKKDNAPKEVEGPREGRRASSGDNRGKSRGVTQNKGPKNNKASKDQPKNQDIDSESEEPPRRTPIERSNSRGKNKKNAPKEAPKEQPNDEKKNNNKGPKGGNSRGANSKPPKDDKRRDEKEERDEVAKKGNPGRPKKNA